MFFFLQNLNNNNLAKPNHSKIKCNWKYESLCKGHGLYHKQGNHIDILS